MTEHRMFLLSADFREVHARLALKRYPPQFCERCGNHVPRFKDHQCDDAVAQESVA